jgi:phospholipid/cholesterol/gamma-HCH transport system substrate-binding protein
MQKTYLTETLVGLFVSAGLIALFFLAMSVSNLRESANQEGYVINAHFSNIGGLKVRSPITISGVRIGRVSNITLDQGAYDALVELRIDQGVALPDDTAASIFTAGLLGEQYIGLDPGGSEDLLQDGDEMELTQSAVILEKLISKFLFSKAEGE